MKKVIWFLLVVLGFSLAGCIETQTSTTVGTEQNTVKKVDTNVKTQASGLTLEQENIVNRLKEDNKIGAIKFLYVISPMTGDVLMTSTVKGKVTSSGKRVNPYETCGPTGDYAGDGEVVGASVNGRNVYTNELMQDDGTYGSSVEYIYWWDTNDRYHQLFMTGMQMVHISSAPIAIHKAVINLDQMN